MEHVGRQLTQLIDSAEPDLRRMSEEESGKAVLAGGWSPKEVMGHLIESASNNHQRFVRAALADALDFPAYDTPGSVRVAAVAGASWTLLVDLWATYNRYLAHVIAHLPADQLGVICRIGNNRPVTLQCLAEDYVRHMHHHLQQIGAGDGRT